MKPRDWITAALVVAVLASWFGGRNLFYIVLTLTGLWLLSWAWMQLVLLPMRVRNWRRGESFWRQDL